MDRVNADGSILPTLPKIKKSKISKSLEPSDDTKRVKKRKNVTQLSCCAVGCKSKYPRDRATVKFFSFSRKNAEQLELWIKAVNRVQPDGTPWLPKSRARLCSKHFVSGEPSSNRTNSDYLPSIFPAANKKSGSLRDFNRPAQRKMSKSSIKSEALTNLDDLHTVEYYHKNGEGHS